MEFSSVDTIIDPNNLWTCGFCDDSIVEENKINAHYCIKKYCERCPKIIKITPWKKFYPQTLDKKVLTSEFKDGEEVLLELPIQDVLSGKIDNRTSSSDPADKDEDCNSQKIQATIKSKKDMPKSKPSSNKKNESSVACEQNETSEDDDEAGEDIESDQNKMDKAKITSKSLFNEKFIQLVYDSPAIWDPRMQLDEKSKERKEVAWLNISKNSGRSVKECKDKWKNLIDTRRSYKKKQQTTTGQAFKKKKTWAHMESMSFLDDVDLNDQKTVTNLEEENECFNSDSENIDLNSKVKRRSRNKEEAIDNLAEAIKNSAPVINMPDVSGLIPQIPSLPLQTEIDTFSALIGCKLKKLDEEEQDDMMEDILQLFRKKKRKQD